MRFVSSKATRSRKDYLIKIATPLSVSLPTHPNNKPLKLPQYELALEGGCRGPLFLWYILQSDGLHPGHEICLPRQDAPA